MGGTNRPIQVEVQVNRKTLQMELDTGASLTVVSEETLELLGLDRQELQPPDTTLCGYSGKALGYINVDVSHNHQTATLPLYVIKGLSLFGRNWQQSITVD